MGDNMILFCFESNIFLEDMSSTHHLLVRYKSDNLYDMHNLYYLRMFGIWFRSNIFQQYMTDNCELLQQYTSHMAMYTKHNNHQ